MRSDGGIVALFDRPDQTVSSVVDQDVQAARITDVAYIVDPAWLLVRSSATGEMCSGYFAASSSSRSAAGHRYDMSSRCDTLASSRPNPDDAPVMSHVLAIAGLLRAAVSTTACVWSRQRYAQLERC